jgi:hypothetical protein
VKVRILKKKEKERRMKRRWEEKGRKMVETRPWGELCSQH